MRLIAWGVSSSSETSFAGYSDTSFSSNPFRALKEPLPAARTRGLHAYNHKLHDLCLGAAPIRSQVVTSPVIKSY